MSIFVGHIAKWNTPEIRVLEMDYGVAILRLSTASWWSPPERRWSQLAFKSREHLISLHDGSYDNFICQVMSEWMCRICPTQAHDRTVLRLQTVAQSGN